MLVQERAKSAIEDLSARFVQPPGQHVQRRHPPNQAEPPGYTQPNLALPQAQPDQAAPDQAHQAKQPDQAAPHQATAAQQPQIREGQLQHWVLHPVPVSSHLLEYIPGRDTLLSAPDLAAGLDALDSGSAEHVLWATAMPRDAFECARPFVLRCVFSNTFLLRPARCLAVCSFFMLSPSTSSWHLSKHCASSFWHPQLRCINIAAKTYVLTADHFKRPCLSCLVGVGVLQPQ